MRRWIPKITVAGGAAVAFDSRFYSGNTSQASGFNYLSSAPTVNGTVGNNANRLLVASATFAQTGISAVGVTWGGTPMNAVGNLTAGGRMTFVFQLIAPATGAQTIACTWTGGSSTIALGAVSYYNVNQSTPVQNNGSDTGTGSPASSDVTSANGNAVFVTHINNNGASTATSAGTQAWIETGFDGNYAAAYRLSTTTTTNCSFTFTGAVAWGNYKVDVVKA